MIEFVVEVRWHFVFFMQYNPRRKWHGCLKLTLKLNLRIIYLFAQYTHAKMASCKAQEMFSKYFSLHWTFSKLGNNAHQEWCAVMSYAYTPNLVQVFLTVPEIMTFYSCFIIAAHLTCWNKCRVTLGRPQRLFGHLHLLTRFRLDSICCFEVMTALNVYWFGLKMLIYAHVSGFLDLTSLMVSSSNKTPKGKSMDYSSAGVLATAVARNCVKTLWRRMRSRTWIFVF